MMACTMPMAAARSVSFPRTTMRGSGSFSKSTWAFVASSISRILAPPVPMTRPWSSSASGTTSAPLLLIHSETILKAFARCSGEPLANIVGLGSFSKRMLAPLITANCFTRVPPRPINGPTDSTSANGNACSSSICLSADAS